MSRAAEPVTAPKKKKKSVKFNAETLERRFRVVNVLDEEDPMGSPFGVVPLVYDAEDKEYWLPIKWKFCKWLQNADAFTSRRKSHSCRPAALGKDFCPDLHFYMFTSHVLHTYGRLSGRKDHTLHRIKMYMLRLDTLIHLLCSPQYKKSLVYFPQFTESWRLSFGRTLMRLLNLEQPRRAFKLRMRLKRERRADQEAQSTKQLNIRAAFLKQQILGKK